MLHLAPFSFLDLVLCLLLQNIKNLTGKRMQECILLFSEDGISHYCHLVFGLFPLS